MADVLGRVEATQGHLEEMEPECFSKGKGKSLFFAHMGVQRSPNTKMRGSYTNLSIFFNAEEYELFERKIKKEERGCFWKKVERK